MTKISSSSLRKLVRIFKKLIYIIKLIKLINFQGSVPAVVETVAYKKHFKHILSDGNKYTLKLTDHNSDTLSEMKFELGVPLSQDKPGKQVCFLKFLPLSL